MTIANLDDFIRPLKNYFYWEPHCYDIPMCYAFKSLFDGSTHRRPRRPDHNAVTDFQAVDALMPQMVTQWKIQRDEAQALHGRDRSIPRPGASAVHADRPDVR